MGGWFPSEASQPELYQCTQSCVWGCGVGEWGVKQRGGGDLNSVSLGNTHTHTPHMYLRWSCAFELGCIYMPRAHVTSHQLQPAADAGLSEPSSPWTTDAWLSSDIKNKVGVTAFKWAHGDCRFQLDRLLYSFSSQHSFGTNVWNGRIICLRHHMKWLLRDA